MTKLSRRATFRIGAAVAVAVGLVTWLALWRVPASVVETPDPWYAWLLAPAFVGMILSGGVHGGAPIWVMMLAMSTSNAFFWTAVLLVSLRIYTGIRADRTTG